MGIERRKRSAPLDLLLWPGVAFVLGSAGGTFGFAFYQAAHRVPHGTKSTSRPMGACDVLDLANRTRWPKPKTEKH
jgi:hypothetical protein